jgi:hypothetical protein
MNFEKENIKRKNPINRNNLFGSTECVDFWVDMGMEYVNTVLNQTVVLYEIDQQNTKMNDIYKESNFNEISFKTPVELNVIYNLEGAELKTYDNSAVKGYYVKVGKLKFQIYSKELEDNECDINRGDYIGLQVTPEHMEYFIVTNDGRVNYDNKHTMMGITPYYRNVECTVVSDITETKNL